MNTSPHDDWQALFDALPIDAVASTDRQDEIKSQAMIRFDAGPPQLAQASGLKKIGHILMTYKAPQWTAATIAIATLVWLTRIGGTPAFALEVLVESILEASTAQYDMIVTTKGQPPLKTKVYYRDPGHFRQELSGGAINIADWQARKIVGLDPVNKRTTVFNLVNLPQEAISKMPADQFGALRDALCAAIDDPDMEVEQLGIKQHSGVETTGYRFTSGSQPMTIWADSKSGFPVRIEFVTPGPPKSDVVMENYRFDVDLDESLFSVEIPEGYSVIQSDVETSAVTEREFIESLKICNAAHDGRFPAGMDDVSMSKHVAGWIAKQQVTAEEGPSAEQMKKVIEVGRGLQFVTMYLPENSDAHYAGAGASESDVDRPVFWYKPTDSSSYRVIYADYSVKNSKSAPDVEGAVKVQPLR